MTIDPRITLALSVQSHKGVYALLLGSGVSRSAGIPTGWEVVQHLIRKLAAAESVKVEPDPETWYKTRFKLDPTYNDVVARLAPTSAERQSLLQSFFEPSESDKAEGLKQPTAAHRAIAKLVAGGYIRVIITTNFDRLMERALQDEGVNATVVATADQVDGMMPAQHAKCVLVKIHGDYLDTRLLNTTEELKDYDSRTKGLLDKLLSDYGLIVCGWSGEWDVALGDALDRTTRHKFSTYWMQRGALGVRASGLVERRGAVVVPIETADAAFADLAEKVAALESLASHDPLSPAVAMATMKRLLANPGEHRIRIHDSVVAETRSVHSHTDSAALPLDSPTPEKVEFVRRVVHVENACRVLLAMLGTGVRWGTPDQYALWSKVVAMLGRQENKGGSIFDVWDYLQRYAGVLALYSMGTVAVGSQNFRVLKPLLVDTMVMTRYSKEVKAVTFLVPPSALYHTAAQWLFETPEGRRRLTPGSERVHDFLKEAVGELFEQPTDFTSAFDLFEVVVAIVEVALQDHPTVGCFAWRNDLGESILSRMLKEIEAVGGKHPIFELGVVRDPAHFKEIAATIQKAVMNRQY